MEKKTLLCAAALFCIANMATARQESKPVSAIWSGVVINAKCGAKEAFAGDPECTKKLGAGEKLALYDDTIREVYLLEPQDPAIGHEGDSVTIAGTLEGNTLRVASLKLLTSIGLPVGRKAPAFSARDQFGQEQTLQTLRGPKGTVLLFFRSADW